MEKCCSIRQQLDIAVLLLLIKWDEYCRRWVLEITVLSNISIYFRRYGVSNHSTW